MLSATETEILLRVRGEAVDAAAALSREEVARRAAHAGAVRFRVERDEALAAEAQLAERVRELELERRAAAAVLEAAFVARDAALSDARALRAALRDAEKRAAAGAEAAAAAAAEARRVAAVAAAAKEVARESAAVAAGAEAERDAARARAARLQALLQRQMEHARSLGVHLAYVGREE